MKPIKATGKRAVLCQRFTGGVFLRIYEADGTFNDLNIRHSDLEIEIVDEDAYIYTHGFGVQYLDHSPQTLGVEGGTDT